MDEVMNSPADDKADYWNKRLKRKVPALTVAEFVVKLNRRLGEEPSVGRDVRFVVFNSQSGQEMVSWQGPAEARALISRVLQAVAKHVQMPAPFQMDPIDPTCLPPGSAG
jgi:hypothetical protein